MDGQITIEMNGKPVGFTFGLPAIRRVGEQYELIPKELDEISKLTGIYAHVLHSGYLNNCLVKGIRPDIKLEDFFQFVEISTFNHDLAAVADVYKTYEDSRTVWLKKVDNVPVEEKKNKKKTLIGMK